MFHLQRIHCYSPSSLPATLQQGKAIATMHPDVETSRRSRRGPGQNSALLASIVVPAGARTAPQVQPVSRPDSIKPTVTQDPTALDKATNTLYTAGIRGRDPKANKPVEGTFRVSASQ